MKEKRAFEVKMFWCCWIFFTMNIHNFDKLACFGIVNTQSLGSEEDKRAANIVLTETISQETQSTRKVFSCRPHLRDPRPLSPEVAVTGVVIGTVICWKEGPQAGAQPASARTRGCVSYCCCRQLAPLRGLRRHAGPRRLRRCWECPHGRPAGQKR